MWTPCTAIQLVMASECMLPPVRKALLALHVHAYTVFQWTLIVLHGLYAGGTKCLARVSQGMKYHWVCRPRNAVAM